MSAISRSRSNRLIQRVRRHARLSTLFRSAGDAEPVAPQSPSQATPLTPGVPRVKAYPVLAPPEVLPESAPPPDEEPAAMGIPVDYAESAAHPATSPQSSPPEVDPKVPQHTAVAQRTSTGSSLPPVSDDMQPKSTIGRTLTAQSPVEPPPSVQLSPPPARVRAAPSPQPQPAVSHPAAPVQAAAQATPLPTTTAPESAPTASTPASPALQEEKTEISEKDWDRLSTIMRRHQEKQETGPAATEESSFLPAQPAEVQREPEPTAPAPQPQADAAQVPAPQTPAGEEATQPLSLEEVWPVAVRAPEPRTAPRRGGSVQREPLAPGAPASPVPVPLAEQERHAERIDQVLQGVASAQPTGSRIEVIPPRQSRPVQPAAAPQLPAQQDGTQEPEFAGQSPEVEAAIARAEGRPAAPVVQRSRAERLAPVAHPPRVSIVPTAPVPRQAAQPASSTTTPPGSAPVPQPIRSEDRASLEREEPSSSPAVQREPATSASQGQVQRHAVSPGAVPAPRIVESEIGPLPADLWTLIGQPVPGETKQGVPASPTSVPPSADSAPAQPIQRSVTINEVTATVDQPSPGVGSGSAAEPVAAPESPSGESPTAESGGTPAQAAAQPDLDEIARQVYIEIKHRLQVEWERLRRKF